jgi:hypothetical protein
MVSLVLNGGGRLLQGFAAEQDPYFQLTVECCFQVMDTVAILKTLSNLFMCHCSRNTMQNVGRGVELLSEHGP